MSNYNAESIQHLSFREGVRTRVSMYLGSPDNEGVLNGFFEVINNATDEALGGFGKEVYIGISPAQKKFTVIDKGRGIPRGPSEKSEEVLITLMTTAHSGAKFNKVAYAGYSRGLNGVGSGATCMSSDYMKIVTKRDGHAWELEFNKGVPLTEAAYPIKETSETGSLFTWIPSQEVFAAEEIVIDFNKINEMIEEYSFFNPGVAFTLENEDTKEKYTYLSRNGIRDFADKVIKKPLHQEYLMGGVKENGVEIEALAKWTGGTGRFHLFVNGAECPDGGQPITGARSAITRTINNLVGGQFAGELVRKGFIYIISVKHPEPMFSNQTKTSIGNPELRKLCDQLFSNMIKEFQAGSPEDFKKLIDTFGKIEKAEAAAERARITIMQSTKEIERTVNRKVFASDKLKDSIKTGPESILLLAEGKSAVGALSQARDPEKTGLLEIRGKIINAMTNPEDKVLQNEEVKLIFSALGQVPGKYNARKLRYGKVGIATDSDSDGSHISLLLLSFFAVYLPEMLEEGRVFKLEAPTHIVQVGQKAHYFFSKEEFDARRVQGSVTLLKGLGEFTAEQMKESMFGPGQRLVKYEWSEEANAILTDLMSVDVEPRREFLFNEVDFSKVVE